MTYDVIVVGIGGVGSAAMFHLAGRGIRVLGLDQFPPGHDRGSSHGHTRIIRQAYFEHASYVPLLLKAYELWAELADRCSQRLLHETGLLQIGPRSGTVLTGVLESARQHGLDVEELTAEAVERRYAGFRVPPDWSGAFERRGGYLRVEDCVLSHVSQAVAMGAMVRSDEPVEAWQADSGGVTVRTQKASYAAKALVLSAGAWSSQLLRDLGLHLELRRKNQYWYRPQNTLYEAAAGCPAFLFETPVGIFYGFPQIDDLGVKVAEHSGGLSMKDPSTLHSQASLFDQARLEAWFREFLPALSNECTLQIPCMYTMTPDEHFIVDRHPKYPQVVFAAGLSGHGFKFTSVLGLALSDLALEGSTTLPIDFLSVGRKGLRCLSGAVDHP